MMNQDTPAFRIYFDTMIYLHYRSFEELDFAQIFGSGTYIVMVPRITIRELDKHKSTHNSSRIRERARKALLNIEKWEQAKEIRTGTSLEIQFDTPELNFKELGLNPAWNDDILIAAALHFQNSNPEDSNVILVTQDSGPRFAAKALGLNVITLPDEYKLPAEDDPVATENQRLRQRLSDLENAMPKIKVAFAGATEKGAHKVFRLKRPTETESELIAHTIERLRREYPQLPHRPPRERSSGEGLDLSGVLGITNDEIDRYNKEARQYVDRYEKYLRQKEIERLVSGRRLEFQIEIANEGTAPAMDVDFHCHFPDGFELVSKLDMPDPLKEPKPPIGPRTHMQILMQDGLSHPFFRSPTFPPITPQSFSPITPPQVDSFSIRKTNSYEVRDHFDSIKHGYLVELPRMVLTFDSHESAHSFSCSFEVHAANLIEPTRGELHFVIQYGHADQEIEFTGQDENQAETEER